MSDSPDTPTEVLELDAQGNEVPLAERSEDELAALAEQMQMGDGARYGGYNYVAEPAEGYDTPGIWTCHYAGTRSGYAHVGHALSWALADHLELPTQLVPHRSIRGIDLADVPKDREEHVTRWLKGAVGLGRALIVTLPPPPAAQMNGYGRTRVVCYATHELNRVSPSCAEICNPGPEEGGFAKIWVKSPFAMRAFIAGGVREERLRLVTPPLIGGPWRVPQHAPKSGTFRFGMLGTWIERKGFDDLLRAYYGAFSRADDVVLEIKTSPLNEYETVSQTEEICVAAAKRARDELGIHHEERARVVFKVGSADTDQEVIDWLAGLDCFANSSYGEGLGVPQIYALAAGVPMVTTAFGAVGELVETIDESVGGVHQLVPHHEERISRDMLRVSRMYDPAQRWGCYEPQAFGAAMRRAFEAPRRSPATAAYVRERFSFDTCAPDIQEALAELVDLQEFAL
ncbi:MAG TPA: glycosyltransferase [Myxococcota bacterium]